MTESGEDWPWYLVTIPHEHVETVHDERRKLLMSLEPGEHASWDYGITTDGTTRVMEALLRSPRACGALGWTNGKLNAW